MAKKLVPSLVVGLAALFCLLVYNINTYTPGKGNTRIMVCIAEMAVVFVIFLATVIYLIIKERRVKKTGSPKKQPRAKFHDEIPLINLR